MRSKLLTKRSADMSLADALSSSDPFSDVCDWIEKNAKNFSEDGEISQNAVAYEAFLNKYGKCDLS